jgi:hypothetical protein
MKQTVLKIWNFTRKTVAITILIFCGLIVIKGNEKSIDGAFFLSIFAWIIGFGNAKNMEEYQLHKTHDKDVFPEHYKVGSSEWLMRQPTRSYTNNI